MVETSRRPIFSRHQWPWEVKPGPNMDKFRAFLERWGRKANTIDAYIQGIRYFYSCLDIYVDIHGITNNCIRFLHFLSWLDMQRHLPTDTYKQQDLEKYKSGRNYRRLQTNKCSRSEVIKPRGQMNALEAIQSNSKQLEPIVFR